MRALMPLLVRCQTARERRTPAYERVSAGSGLTQFVIQDDSASGPPLPLSKSDKSRDGGASIKNGGIPSGTTTGIVETYLSGPDFQMSTQLGRFDWNYRWSPDSRHVAYDEKVTTDMGWGGWESLGG